MRIKSRLKTIESTTKMVLPIHEYLPLILLRVDIFFTRRNCNGPIELGAKLKHIPWWCNLIRPKTEHSFSGFLWKLHRRSRSVEETLLFFFARLICECEAFYTLDFYYWKHICRAERRCRDASLLFIVRFGTTMVTVVLCSWWHSVGQMMTLYLY